MLRSINATLEEESPYKPDTFYKQYLRGKYGVCAHFAHKLTEQSAKNDSINKSS